MTVNKWQLSHGVLLCWLLFSEFILPDLKNIEFIVSGLSFFFCAEERVHLLLIFWVFRFSHGLWMRFADDVSVLLIGSIFIEDDVILSKSWKPLIRVLPERKRPFQTD